MNFHDQWLQMLFFPTSGHLSKGVQVTEKGLKNSVFPIKKHSKVPMFTKTRVTEMTYKRIQTLELLRI